jgi:hypothetical protein
MVPTNPKAMATMVSTDTKRQLSSDCASLVKLRERTHSGHDNGKYIGVA